jgi:hypothetical protein
MKLSELKKQIKDNIYEILSEVEDTPSEQNARNLEIKAQQAKIKAAQERISNLNKGLSEVADDEEKEDTWNKEDKEDKRSDDKEPSKSELAKEKVKTVSKFKVPTSDFEDFKTRLKTLVKKIKDMEKGAERDKKMAALKQFIKKPELVKAFKERDVQIDTGGLVGENKTK